MSRDYSAENYTKVRRSDRAVEDDLWIKRFLHRAAVGTLATVFNGQPFLNTNLFVYDESTHVIYMHTARTGRTRANVEREKQVCFSVSELGRLLPADVAMEFSCEYSGVTAFGAVSIVDEDEARYALQLMLNKYFPHLKPGRDYRPISDDELKRASVYRIDIEQLSGKMKKEDENFPGAFLYGTTFHNKGSGKT